MPRVQRVLGVPLEPHLLRTHRSDSLHQHPRPIRNPERRWQVGHDYASDKKAGGEAYPPHGEQPVSMVQIGSHRLAVHCDQ